MAGYRIAVNMADVSLFKKWNGMKTVKNEPRS